MSEPEYLGASKAAEHLEVSVTRLNAIRTAMRERGIDFGKEIAGRWLYTYEELDAYKNSRNPKGGRPKNDALMLSPIVGD